VALNQSRSVSLNFNILTISSDHRGSGLRDSGLFLGPHEQESNPKGLSHLIPLLGMLQLMPKEGLQSLLPLAGQFDLVGLMIMLDELGLMVRKLRRSG
jgi:hypothetical protein